MPRYPWQVDRQYLSYRSGGLNKIQMIDGGTPDLNQNLVACNRRRRHIIEYQRPTVLKQSNSLHASSPYVCSMGAARTARGWSVAIAKSRIHYIFLVWSGPLALPREVAEVYLRSRRRCRSARARAVGTGCQPTSA